MFDEPGFPNGEELDDDAPALFNFVYCSRAADGVDDAEVGRIVEVAQRNNLAHGITGVLVFGSGVFFQWIEGPGAQIEKLIATLHDDPRHYDIVSLSQSEEEARAAVSELGDGEGRSRGHPRGSTGRARKRRRREQRCCAEAYSQAPRFGIAEFAWAKMIRSADVRFEPTRHVSTKRFAALTTFATLFAMRW